MNHIQSDVRHFMELAKQATPEYPIIPNEEVRLLRAKLILEEAFEQLEALGIQPCWENGDGRTYDVCDTIKLLPQGEPNLAEIADGICDQVYVSVGTAVACGIDLKPIWELVHEANLAKFGSGSTIREGKQMKPPGWVAPDEKIRQEIVAQTPELEC